MNKIKIAFIGLMVAACSFIGMPAFASSSTVDCPADLPNRDIICGKGTEDDMMSKVGSVLTVIYGLIGILAVVMIVVGGVKYMTSQGDPGKIQSAKNTIMYAIIGLVVTLAAFAITNLILSALS